MIENPIEWPNGARCAVAFTFDMDAESLLHIYLGETAHNRPALSSLLRYGPEVAIPRLIDTFKRHDLRQTFFVPGWCIERYPRAIRLILENRSGTTAISTRSRTSCPATTSWPTFAAASPISSMRREPGRAAIALHPTPFLNSRSICCWTRVSTMTPRFLATTYRI